MATVNSHAKKQPPFKNKVFLQDSSKRTQIRLWSKKQKISRSPLAMLNIMHLIKSVSISQAAHFF
jgi:hypothetical protein